MSEPGSGMKLIKLPAEFGIKLKIARFQSQGVLEILKKKTKKTIEYFQNS